MSDPRVPARPAGQARRLAGALERQDAVAVDEIVTSARRQLQSMLEDELNRLVGELVVEVGRQRTLREKVGRAILLGAAFLGSLPPPRVLRQLEDQQQFLERCRHACDGLITFLSGELNRGLEAAGVPAMPDSAARLWVKDAIEHLRIALERTEEDGVDRRTQLALWFVGQFELPPEQGFPERRPGSAGSWLV